MEGRVSRVVVTSVVRQDDLRPCLKAEPALGRAALVRAQEFGYLVIDVFWQ